MRIALTILFAGLCAVLGSAALRAGADVPSARAGVAALLDGSATAWNHGDLDTFMKTYEDSPQTTYVGEKAVIRGYAQIRAHYAAHYKPGRMGTLSVSDLAVRPLGPDYAVATARWHLARATGAGGNVSGLFTLVLHRNADGWHIIVDHTP